MTFRVKIKQFSTKLLNPRSNMVQAKDSIGLDINSSRTITTFGSVFLFLNNTIGPGLALLPALFQQAGWLPCALCIMALSLMSYGVGRMLTFSIRKIPHNQDDDLKIEYLDLIKYYIGFNDAKHELVMKFCQMMYMLFMTAFLISSIVQTVQTLDLAIDRVFGHSVGFIYFPVDRMGITYGHCLESISPFCDDDVFVFSIGTLIIFALIIPFCLKDLQEAIWIQYIGSYGTILLLALWCFMLSFSAEFDPDNIPVATGRVYNVMSINLYNIAFICTYPSWLNEKKEYVSPRWVLQCIAIGTSIVFILTGMMGGMAFYPFYSTTGDMLSKLNHFKAAPSITNPTLIHFFETLGPVSCYFYPILQCLTGIPVFCTVIRYNLINTHILKTKWTANMVAIVFPFMASIFLYHGAGFNIMLNWTGSIFSSFINFVLPIFFYYKAVLRPQSDWERIATSDHHISLLRRSKIDIFDVNAASIVGDGDEREIAYSHYKGASQSPLEIEDSTDINEVKRNKYLTESDGLLLGMPRNYNTLFSSAEMVGDDVSLVIRNHAEERARRRARKALCFLTFTILMTLATLGLDCVPYFI